MLNELTDPTTVSRGFDYALTGRVVELDARADRVTALVAGTQDYRVEFSAEGWSCDCPVGVTGAFCKHCVAVALAADFEGEPEVGGDPSGADVAVAATGSDTGNTTEAGSWLDSLSVDELRRLLAEAIVHVDGMAEFVARSEIAATDDMAALADEVVDTFKPRRRFYDYRAANNYAREVEPVVQLLEERANGAMSAEFLTIVQKAIDQSVRAILRSDDSSGMQGIQIERLLDAHALAASKASLSKSEVTKLVKWLFRFRFGGKQDFFHIDICRYADVIGERGVEQYRKLIDDVDPETDSFGLAHARGRLAVLSRDPQQIVGHFGGDLEHTYQYVKLVQALDEAGQTLLAVQYAQDGLAAEPRSHQLTPLVDYVVEDARQHGALDEVVRVRRENFQNRPSTTTYAALERAAKAAGMWNDEQQAAGELLAEVDPRGWVFVLHDQGNDDAAWAAAEAHPDRVEADLWERLFRRRVKTDPGSTLVHYRRIVDETLVSADRRNYRTAARMLRRMRDAADAAGRSQEFTSFLAEVADRNRRRPALAEELRRVGLA